MKQFYIAAPYTATPERKLLNIEVARHMGCLVAELGIMPLMPTVNSAGMDVLARPLSSGEEDWGFWMEGTSKQLSKCDGVIFCQGWHKSTGCIMEMKQAQQMGIPIFTDIRGVEEWMKDLDKGVRYE